MTKSVSAHMKGRSYSQPPTITAGLGHSKLKSFPAPLHYHVRSTKRELSIMSTIDANRVIFTGENSAIRLSNNDSDSTRRMLRFGEPCHPEPGRAMFSI